MSIPEKLNQYVPEESRKAKIEIREELAPIVGKISRILPQEKIWELFSSTPNETGGKIVFPYCRIDAAIIGARDWVYILTHYKHEPSEKEATEDYSRASIQTLRALLWVEIGFDGLENLAVSPASRNWTSGVGHFVDDEQRAKGIMTGGAALYETCLREFVKYRDEQGITDDCFTKYGMESLLDKFRVK